jgi:hypothetical protein
VISNFGNSQSNETTVEIFGDSVNATPVTIVLSNYHRVKWRVVLKGTIVQKIFLVGIFPSAFVKRSLKICFSAVVIYKAVKM